MHWKKVKWLPAVAAMVSIPSAALSVMALTVNAEHEEKAAFCLRLLEQAGQNISYDERRKIKLFAEKLSYSPDESKLSHMGRVSADELLSTIPTKGALAEQLSVCLSDLTAITAAYSWHVCGYANGSLAEDWSSRDRAEFYEYTRALDGEKGMRLLKFD